MKRNPALLLILITLIGNSCGKSIPEFEHIIITEEMAKAVHKDGLSEVELRDWHFKDLFDDSIPGISLDKAYSFLENKTPDTVVVAVIDMTLDLKHEDLADFIWKNHGEIPNNGVDDDGNGYTDDINGWNFLGWKNGEGSEFVSYEYTRILKKYDRVFNGKKKEDIEKTTFPDYELYLKAKETYEDRLEYANTEYENAVGLSELNEENNRIISDYLPVSSLTMEELDSLSLIHEADSSLQDAIDLRKTLLQYGINDENIKTDKLKAEERLHKLLNLEYNDREPLGDSIPDDLSYTRYGNNNVSYNTSLLDHGTLVTGVIAANRENNKGAKGITNAVKIMPLSISAYGDEHDKDMALAIRYAVDNGAKIINISSGKKYSLYKEWVLEAIAYAAKRDVLIVTSAGNDGLDLDRKENTNYPNDLVSGGKEVSDNFIKVGSSTHSLDKNLFDPISNYGRNEVDILAPGMDIFTTYPLGDQYKFKDGTSFAAPMVTGIAALIRAYYPGLSAEEVKKVILESGVRYEWDVDVSKDEDKPVLLPFKSLSKSGSIANAYFALQYAEVLNDR